MILTYHRFSKDNHPLKISAGEFSLHLSYLKKHCNVLPLKTIVDSLEKGGKLPPSSVAITIDDGYADAYDVAFPILKKFGFHATLFAITDFVEGKIWLWTDKMRYVLKQTAKYKLHVEFEDYDTIVTDLGSEFERLRAAGRINQILKKLPNKEKESKILKIARSLDVSIPEIPTPEYSGLSWEMAREMDVNNLSIESHTVTHPMLTKIDEEQLSFELEASKATLESELDRSINTLCYPNGAYDERVSNAVEMAGYNCAVTTQYGFANGGANRFLLKRADALGGIVDFAQTVSGFESFKLKVTGNQNESNMPVFE